MTKPRVKKPKEYFTAHTSAMAKRIGDSVLIVGTTLSAISIENLPKSVTYASIILTLVGKLVTNFFAEKTPDPSDSN